MITFRVILYRRAESSNGLPPKPPVRPRHTLQTIEVDANGGNVTSDACDGEVDNRRLCLSPQYVDPNELNTAFQQDGSVK